MGGLFDWVGDAWNNLTGGSTTDYTSYYDQTYGSGSSAGFGGDWGNSPSPYLSYDNKDYQTQQDWWWKQYGDYGGTLPYTSTTPGTTSTTNFFDDLTTGTGDFFNGINSTLQGLGGLFNTGLTAYANLQQTINSLNPQDQIVQLPGSNTIMIKRDGQLVPFNTLYPQFSAEANAAAKSQQTQTLLLVGALGLGLVFILKKK